MNETTALAKFDPANLQEADALSAKLANSNLLPEALRKKPEDIFVTLLTGRELGLSPMQSIRGLYVVNGKAVMSADMMVALVLSRREVCEFFRLVESTDEKAIYQTKRTGSEPVTMSFTAKQAQQAGLTGKGTWKAYPAAMLRARCASALARAVYPDLVAGVYETGEGEEIRANTKREIRTATVTNAPPLTMPADDFGNVIEANFTPADVPVEQPAAEPAKADPLDALRASIAAAATDAELLALVPAIKALPKEQQDAIRSVYGERKNALAGK